MTEYEANKYVRKFYNDAGWCWCGAPETVMTLIKDALELVAEKCPDGTNWNDWYEAHKKREEALFGPNPGIRYFVWYMFDVMGLTEHGGSVPGWLDEKGRELLEALRLCDLDFALQANQSELDELP